MLIGFKGSNKGEEGNVDSFLGWSIWKWYKQKLHL